MTETTTHPFDALRAFTTEELLAEVIDRADGTYDGDVVLGLLRADVLIGGDGEYAKITMTHDGYAALKKLTGMLP